MYTDNRLLVICEWRLWTVGSGDVTGIVYGTCDSCVATAGAPPALALQGILDFTVFWWKWWNPRFM